MRTNNKIVCTGFMCAANIFDTDPCNIDGIDQVFATALFAASGETKSVTLRVKDINDEKYYVLVCGNEYYIYEDGIKSMTSNDLLYAMSTMVAQYFKRK